MLSANGACVYLYCLLCSSGDRNFFGGVASSAKRVVSMDDGVDCWVCWLFDEKRMSQKRLEFWGILLNVLITVAVVAWTIFVCGDGCDPW